MSKNIISLNNFETNKIPSLDQINNSSFELLNSYLQHDYIEFEKNLLKDSQLCSMVLSSLRLIKKDVFKNTNHIEDLLMHSKNTEIFNYESVISLSLSIALQLKWVKSLDDFNKTVGKKFYLDHLCSSLFLIYKLFENNSDLNKKYQFSNIVILASLQNIGLALISGLFRIEYSMLICLAKKNPLSSLEVIEQNLISSNNSCNNSGSFLSHAKIGAIALNKWGLPRKYVDSVLLHHKENYQGPFKEYIYLMQFCNNILAKYKKSDVRSCIMPEYLQDYFHDIDVNIDLTVLEEDEEFDFT